MLFRPALHDGGRPEEAEQGQEESEEAGEGLRRLPRLRLAHQADPQAPRARPQQGERSNLCSTYC